MAATRLDAGKSKSRMREKAVLDARIDVPAMAAAVRFRTNTVIVEMGLHGGP